MDYGSAENGVTGNWGSITKFCVVASTPIQLCPNVISMRHQAIVKKKAPIAWGLLHSRDDYLILDVEGNIGLTGKLEEGGSPSKFNTIDKLIWIHIE